MKVILALLQDTYFWGGVAALIFSVVGIRWILRSLHAQPEEPEVMLQEEAPFPSEVFGPPAPRRAAPEPVAESRPSNERTSRVASGTDASVDALAQQLDRIEKALAQIQVKLGQPGAKTANSQIDQIAAKIDKIYQVLAQISSEETKP